ncbi:MAG TPA: hypothetical protein VGJ02_02790, partial [Pyrinomonadaceae bacterium]
DPEMAGGQPGESEQSASSKQTSVPPKADRAAKQSAKDNTNIDVGDVHVEGDTVIIGNTRIGPDGIRPNVNPNAMRVPRVNIPPITSGEVFPGVTREQFNRMPPAQQRSLMEARRRLLMLQRRGNLPQPQTPPDQP